MKVLLLGGTSETAPLATALARAGHNVLVSTATDIALDVGTRTSGGAAGGLMCQACSNSCAKNPSA